MTKEQLELRAANLEYRLDNDRFYDEDEEIEAEQELCEIYMKLKEIRKKENQQ